MSDSLNVCEHGKTAAHFYNVFQPMQGAQKCAGSWCNGSTAVNEMIDHLDLHADDVKPPAESSAAVDVDLKHETASVEITERT